MVSISAQTPARRRIVALAAVVASLTYLKDIYDWLRTLEEGNVYKDANPPVSPP